MTKNDIKYNSINAGCFYGNLEKKAAETATKDVEVNIEQQLKGLTIDEACVLLENIQSKLMRTATIDEGFRRVI